MRRDPRARSAAGFTLIEILTVMVVVGILAGIALPTLRSAVYRADAAKVVTDVAAVRQAVFAYREDVGDLPGTGRWGDVPPGLEPYLNGSTFTYKDLEYRLQVNARRGRVDFNIRYPRGSQIGAALQRFRSPGRDSGSVTWSATRTVFRLLEANQ